MNTYSPIFSSITDSSLWREQDFVCKAFITLLAVKDMNHVAHLNAFTLGQKCWPANPQAEKMALEALQILQSPDTVRIEPQPFDGRRVEKVAGGYLVLNGHYYEVMARDFARRLYKSRKEREYRMKKNQDEQEPDLLPPQQASKPSKPDLASPEKDAPEPPDEVDEWVSKIYSAYPRKVGRPAAERAIKKALDKMFPEELLEKTKLYAAAREGQDHQFTPHPATWFNQERWNDSAQPVSTGTKNGSQSFSNSPGQSIRVPAESWKPTPEQIRIGKIFNRTDLTKPWRAGEIEAYNRVEPVDMVEIASIENYYNLARERDFKWDSLQRLLENWQSMVDKAMTFKEPSCL